ncbi:hypothetical protein HDU97_006946 [Phlyctochytrium planicorne]|nr:hypothetical protein HDU97_006946 [Phlyctochytrium planicorne]
MSEANFDNKKGVKLGELNLKPDCRQLSLCLPSHKRLEKLQLMDNKISTLESFKSISLPALKTLDLSNNRIAEIQELRHLKALPSLQHLGLLENKVSSSKNFRNQVFSMFDKLISLDGTNKDGEEIVDSEDEDPDDDGEEDEYESDGDGDGEEQNGEEAEDGDVGEAGDGEVEGDQEDEDEDDDDDDDDELEDEEDENEEDDIDDGPGLKFLIEVGELLISFAESSTKGDIQEDADDEDYQEGSGKKRKGGDAAPATAKKSKS